MRRFITPGQKRPAESAIESGWRLEKDGNIDVQVQAAH